MLHAAPLQRLGRYTGQRIGGPNSSWAAGDASGQAMTPGS